MTYRRARSYAGPLWGALISSLLFGLYHGNMVQFVYSFLMGLLFAAICQNSGGILASAAAHSAANLWAIFSTPVFGWLQGLSPAGLRRAWLWRERWSASAAGFCCGSGHKAGKGEKMGKTTFIMIGAAILDVLAKPVNLAAFRVDSIPAETLTTNTGGDAMNEARTLAAQAGGQRCGWSASWGRTPPGR